MVTLIAVVALMQKILIAAGALWRKGKWIKLVYKTIKLYIILFLEVKEIIYIELYHTLFTNNSSISLTIGVP